VPIETVSSLVDKYSDWAIAGKEDVVAGTVRTCGPWDCNNMANNVPHVDRHTTEKIDNINLTIDFVRYCVKLVL
jgi:hypothetical protein